MKHFIILFFSILAVSCTIVDTEQNAIPDIAENNLERSEQGQADTTSENRNSSVAGKWRIGLFVDDNNDLTVNFDGFEFEFSESGEIQAFYDDWKINLKNDQIIDLEYREENYVDRLVFIRKDDDTNLERPFVDNLATAEQLFSELFENKYSITKLIDDNDDETSKFINFTVSFDRFGIVSLSNPSGTSWNGYWKVEFNGNVIVLDIDFDYDGLPDYLDDDWKLISIDGDFINFQEKGYRDQLTIQKQ
jgi:hypothetical protein